MKTQSKDYAKGLAIAIILLLTGLLPTVNATTQTQPASFNAADHWALCVGIGVYAENPEQDRPLMIDEVQDFSQTLINSGWLPDHVNVIKGENATVRNILDGFKWLRTHEDADDVSLVFLSTHGSPLLLSDGSPVDLPPKDENDSADEILVTYWGFALPTAFLWDDEINVELNRLQSQGVCLIVDSCFAGGFNDHWPATTGAFTQTAQQWTTGFIEDVKGQNRIILMGSREDEEAYSGGFAPWLIDALRGYADSNHDGIVTAEEAFAYVEPRPFGQTPTIYDGYPGELALVTVPQRLPASNTLKDKYSLENGRASASMSIMVHGYINDATTDDPIGGANVNLHGRTSEYGNYEDNTTTAPDGYYEITAPAGRYRLTGSADGYCDRDSSSFSLTDGMSRWINLTLYPRPEENATIQGYIVDNTTHSPLNGAEISLVWSAGPGHSYRNTTYTDTSGYYTMQVAEGTLELTIQMTRYFQSFIDHLSIASYETKWINASLVPHPAETAAIRGYVTDADTDTPLANAQFTYQWIDFTTDRNYLNETTSDETGYYSINVAPGELYREIRITGYDPYDPYRHDGTANATTWQNISVTRTKPTFGFLQPLNALYMGHKRILPRSSPVVFGSLNVSIYFEEMWFGGGDVDKVEFYLDGALQTTVLHEPFSWSWTKRSFGKHTLKVTAYDSEGDTASREIQVLKIL